MNTDNVVYVLQIAEDFNNHGFDVEYCATEVYDNYESFELRLDTLLQSGERYHSRSITLNTKY